MKMTLSRSIKGVRLHPQVLLLASDRGVSHPLRERQISSIENLASRIEYPASAARRPPKGVPMTAESVRNTVGSLGVFSGFHSKSNLFYGIIHI